MFNRISLLFGIALVSTLLLAGTAALGQATGVGACSDEWDDSSAAGSCDQPTFRWFGNNSGESKCEIETECNTGTWNLGTYPLVQHKKAASITTSMENVDSLVNCSGNLRIGSC